MTFDLLKLTTPAQPQAHELAAELGLQTHGLTNLRCAYWNLPPEALYEEITFRGEGRIAHDGAIVVSTGSHTSRSAQDKFVVHEPGSSDHIAWGEYNRPIAADTFEQILARLAGFLQGRDVFVQDCFAGAEAHRLPIRVVTERAWHSLFARTMFVPAGGRDACREHVPEFTLICAPSFRAHEPIDATRSPTFIVLDLARRLCVIGGTEYAGEIKKSVFTLLNYLLPLEGVLPMHCSANVGAGGDVALFFGLSGTGKTTLSADASRGLIGDDEHGWSDDGVFNFENGCYAKVIRLSPRAEPEIHGATHRFGTILENVVFDPVTRRIDLDDDRLTQNTRASYPLASIANAVPGRHAGHPRTVVFLTCDAQGVMPPLARLDADQAVYHFLSGYTSKIGGTEAGVGLDPEIAFSACFGAPFMVHPPAVYAELLRRRILSHDASCWLLNTGWTGGPYGVGERISIRHTRTLLRAVLSGALDEVETYIDPVFGFEVPKRCPDLPEDILYPSRAWPSEDEYWDRYQQLAARFVGNFLRFAPECPPHLESAGPRRLQTLSP